MSSFLDISCQWEHSIGNLKTSIPCTYQKGSLGVFCAPCHTRQKTKIELKGDQKSLHAPQDLLKDKDRPKNRYTRLPTCGAGIIFTKLRKVHIVKSATRDASHPRQKFTMSSFRPFVISILTRLIGCLVLWFFCRSLS